MSSPKYSGAEADSDSERDSSLSETCPIQTNPNNTVP
jgi:hypothetical protein